MTLPVDRIAGQLALLAFSMLAFASCKKENLDIRTEEVDVVEPQVLILENCFLELNSASVNFKEECEAALYIGETCTDGISELNYHYIVYDKDFDFSDTPGGNKAEAVMEGIPGLGMAMDGEPGALSMLLTYAPEHVFVESYPAKPGETWIVISQFAYLTTPGFKAGDHIEGTVEGNLMNKDDPTIIESFSGSFCALVLDVCQ